MDYLYENLGDERFQEFCSLLISKEFPNFQAFPVGQPDGGRDTIVYTIDTPQKDFIVFQVKFVRNADIITDPHKWLVGIISEEASKIEKLIPKGAKGFYLLTNVRGTAHLDSGSKDKINKVLEETISVPSLCWWRDDLSRLFEKDPLFKWSFPEIINGQDILNGFIFQYFTDDKERKESIVKAYLADQYKMDDEVKFKQIDLQNKLLKLFTDVPIRVKKFNEKNRKLRNALWYFEGPNVRRQQYIDDSFAYDEKETLGAAGFLLHSKVQNDIDRILLEGGPGQGKSTISQYICQVHRSRLLSKAYDISLLPSSIKNSPIRLPFKIDLRDIASWIEKRNPYQGRLNDEQFNKIWRSSLESFLIGHIVYHSQVDSITSSDIIAIVSNSSVLIVFDGFDEIADLKTRELIIELINDGITRLKENSKSLQVLITSRPAAFSDTIGFSVDIYPHFELTDITLPITKQYVDNWIKASRLDNKEASEIKKLVEEKLEMPHLRDLAKSPMQLAIFISLLRTRGQSLPNKRTALYESYIDLFFNRESEKNVTIRENRDLIIDIHQYLAWVLHSEAEMLKNSGSMHIDDLKLRLNAYLDKEGHKTDIADKLFRVVEERVCALVSRVQGTYEFEVQPLREYFCAKYLYNTAPHSPQGKESKDTKPDRFDVIARNVYWNNVVRFFAGCFGKGELPMLILQLRSLQEDSLLKNTNYPRIITSQLLSDFVFTQYPKLLREVVSIIIDGINVGNIINQGTRTQAREPILLPEECGRAEIVEECFGKLKDFPHSDYANELIGLIKNNPYNTLDIWLSYLNDIPQEKWHKWFEFGYQLQLVHTISDECIVDVFDKTDIEYKPQILQRLINGNRFDMLNNNPYLKSYALKFVLEGKLIIGYRSGANSGLKFLSNVTNINTLKRILGKEDLKGTLLDFLAQRYGYRLGAMSKMKPITEFSTDDKIDQDIHKLKELISNSISAPIVLWRSNIEVWDRVVEAGRNVYGEQIIFNLIALLSAGIKSKDQTFDEFDNLRESSHSLCKRVRYARMRSGNIKYWEQQLEPATDISFTLAIVITWATPKTIAGIFPLLRNKIDNLSSAEFNELRFYLWRVFHLNSFTESQATEIGALLSHTECSMNVKYLISIRLPDKSRQSFIYANFPRDEAKKYGVTEFILMHVLDQYLTNTSDLQKLDEVSSLYRDASRFEESYYYKHSDKFFNMPLDVANKIMSDARSYPTYLSSTAEKVCRLYANRHIKAVGETAVKNKWFENGN